MLFKACILSIIPTIDWRKPVRIEVTTIFVTPTIR